MRQEVINNNRWKAKYYRKQKRWKSSHASQTMIVFRGNRNWCIKYGEDLTKPRFIGDKMNSERLYPSHFTPLEIQELGIKQIKSPA